MPLTSDPARDLADTEVSFSNVGAASTQSAECAGRTANHVEGSASSDYQRFRVLRPHASGGLGAVFVALDTELHREVAIKQILENRADDPISRARFLLEAEVTGGLEHPGIVPVYGLGTYADGRPYYAMRFVRGDSLREVIEQFHTDSGLKGDPGHRWLELRKLLRRFTDVCNAIDYAHNRGVLHRDIKPSNIIVGKYGETLVVDWGLAQPLVDFEPESASGERPLVLSAASGATEALPGSTLGTPAYMSPEQAEGDLERLGPRSDVYSLGATLYCLLTGKPPARGDNIAAVLMAVQKGEFSPPRKLDPSIDKALEAICLKAMALKPENRYASPRALADDIDLWLADEPVGAYRERTIKRVGRWLRRHRTWTFAAIAGLIGISLAATVGAIVIELKHYKNVVDQRTNDLDLRQQLAGAYFRVGEVTQEIGSRAEAIEAFRKAQTIWESLAAAEPANREFQVHLADCHLAIGKLLNDTSEADEVDARRVALWQDRPPGELAALALKKTNIAAVIGHVKTPISRPAYSVRQLDLDQAAANLKLAIARGFRDLGLVQSDPDSQILLSRDDLEIPIIDMQFPERPFANQ